MNCFVTKTKYNKLGENRKKEKLVGKRKKQQKAEVNRSKSNTTQKLKRLSTC